MFTIAIQRDGKWVSDFRGLGGREEWRVTADGCGISLGSEENVLKLIMAMVVQL